MLRTYRFVRSLRLGLPVAMAALSLQLVHVDAAPSSAYEATLRQLGNAYAQDHSLRLTRVQAAVATRVTDANRAKWVTDVVKDLSIGYAPRPDAFHTIQLSRMKGLMHIRMGKDRSPQQVVERVVVPGAVILRAVWDFGGPASVRSYAVFSAAGKPMFDTILFMPAIEGPVFAPRHF